MIHVKKDRCGYNGYTCLGVESLKDAFTSKPRSDTWTFKGVTNTVTDELSTRTKQCIVNHACVSCATDFSPFTGTFFDFYSNCAKDIDLQDTGILEPTTTDPTDILAPIDTNIGGYTSLTPEYQKVHLTLYKYEFDIDLSGLFDLFDEELENLENSIDARLQLLESQAFNYDQKFDIIDQKFETTINNFNTWHEEFKTFEYNTDVKINNIENNLTIIEGDITTIENNLTIIEGDITTIENNITIINNNITTLNTFMNKFNTNYKPVIDRLKSINGVVKGHGDGTYEGLDTSTCEE